MRYSAETVIGIDATINED